MKKIIFMAAMLAACCGSGLAEGFVPEIQVVPADEDQGSFVNSEIIIGKDETLLVDTQRTAKNAARVVEAIKRTGKPLSTVFITHAHPDHFLGSAEIRAAFPNAKFVATKKVCDEIASKGSAIRNFVASALENVHSSDTVPSSIIVPTPIEPSAGLSFGGGKLTVIETGPGESDGGAMLYIPDAKALISGDTVYNRTHLFLAEGRPDGWLAELAKVKQMRGVRTIYPGHGAPTTMAAVAADTKYIENYKAIMSKAAKPDEVIAKMKALYPDYQMERFLIYSVNENFATLNNQGGSAYAH